MGCQDHLQKLYRSCMALRPKIVKLIDKYSQKQLPCCIFSSLNFEPSLSGRHQQDPPIFYQMMGGWIDQYSQGSTCTGYQFLLLILLLDLVGTSPGTLWNCTTDNQPTSIFSLMPPAHTTHNKQESWPQSQTHTHPQPQSQVDPVSMVPFLKEDSSVVRKISIPSAMT